MTLVPTMTISVYPGVLRSPQLDPNRSNTEWFREHSAVENSAEVRHLRQAEMVLNRLRLEPEQELELFAETAKTLDLFAEAMLSGEQSSFQLERYMR